MVKTTCFRSRGVHNFNLWSAKKKKKITLKHILLVFDFEIEGKKQRYSFYNNLFEFSACVCVSICAQLRLTLQIIFCRLCISHW